MRRRVATFWHATFSVAAGFLYFFFVLPRWPELTGDTSHALGTVARIVAGVVIALAALPVVFTLLRSRRPEFGTPALALTLLTASVVAHVLAGVLIVGTAVSEIWLSQDNLGQWLFGVYGAAAAIAILGIVGFYLSFVAELPPPPPKPVKPKKDKKDKKQRRRGKKGSKAEATDEAPIVDATADTDEADEDAGDSEKTADANADVVTAEGTTETAADQTDKSPEVESTAVEPESSAEEPPAAEDTVDTESSTGGLRNRRPTGKESGAHRRRRSRRGVAVED